MSDKSKIEWTDATWNPVTGCSHVSEGCRACYAERLSLRRGWTKKPWTAQNAVENVVLHPDRVEQPLRWKRPCRVFVNSMSDLFHEQVPDSFIEWIFDVMTDAHQHTYQVLTKRPRRMLEFISGYDGGGAPNWLEACPWIWFGVSVEDQRTADERIPPLLQTPAAMRFVSAEPLLGPIDFRMEDRWLEEDCYSFRDRIQWIIVGGESGPDARPMHPQWARGLRDQCQAAGVKFFIKQICERGQKVPFEKWPDDLKVREYPDVER